MERRRALDMAADMLVITAATAVVAAAVYFFLIPSQVPVGSITSLAMVLSMVIPLRISVITMLLNVVLLVLGFLFIGREFGAKTVYTALLLPAFLAVLEELFPNFTSLMGDPFLDVVAYIFLVSVGLAVLFNHNASSGGLDIVAKFLNKFLHMELGRAMALSGMCVALTAVLAYDGKTVVLSVLGTYLNGLVLDHFIFGTDLKKRVCIISQREEEIRQFIIHTLHSGATIYQAIGGYDGQVRREIIALVDKGEYRKLMDFISRVDREAFVAVYTVNEMFYRPKPGRRGRK